MGVSYSDLLTVGNGVGQGRKSSPYMDNMSVQLNKQSIGSNFGTVVITHRIYTGVVYTFICTFHQGPTRSILPIVLLWM